MLINNIRINKNHIIGILEVDKKDILNLDEFDMENTVYEELNETLEIKKYTEEVKKKKIEELSKMLNLPISVFDRHIGTLCESEKIKVYFAKKLIDNSDIIVIDDFFKYLDLKNKNKILKILLKLKKYHNKTIFIYTNDLDNIFEVIDDILIKEDEIIYNNKFEIIKDLKNYKPSIIDFIDKLKKRYPNICYKDSINEIIKEIYRELR